MAGIDGLSSDLLAEHEALDAVLTGLSEEQWSAETPAEGWQVRDQVSHLAYFDTTAALSLVSPERFDEHKAALFAGRTEPDADVALGRSVNGATLLADWRTGRRDLLDAIAVADPDTRVHWYGPDMSLASFVTARLMETWAHGQDARDALLLPPSVSDRLRHICHIGVSARRYAYLVHGVEDPGTPVRVEVTSPAGVVWAWGPSEAPGRIHGSALGLALVFTQRRHPDDTDVRAEGDTAEQWLAIAQAYAGPAGRGRSPGLGMPSEPPLEEDPAAAGSPASKAGA